MTVELIRKGHLSDAQNLIKLTIEHKDFKDTLQFLTYTLSYKFLNAVIQSLYGDLEAKVKCNTIIDFYHDTVQYKTYARKMQNFYSEITSKYQDSPY